jgi:hypothetical protein
MHSSSFSQDIRIPPTPAHLTSTCCCVCSPASANCPTPPPYLFYQANSSLTSLNLHGCKRISDKGLSAVSNLPLKALSLGLTRVKDEGMAYLARLTQLTELHCTNEELTDEGIHHLSSLTDLNTLALRDCCEVSGDALLVRARLICGWLPVCVWLAAHCLVAACGLIAAAAAGAPSCAA